MKKPTILGFKQTVASLLTVLLAFSPLGNYVHAALTVLADEPTTGGSVVPPNVLLDLSVEFPTDQLYVGDLLGNVWRFDLRDADGVYPPPVKIAVLSDPAGNPQPITTIPKIEVARDNRFVFVGTGKDLAAADGRDGQQQSMYGIRDGNKTEPATGTTLTRNAFTVVTDITKGIPVPEKGWVFNLPGGSTATGRERITVDIDANAGVVLFVGNIASNDPCAQGGIANTYAVEFDTGRSVILDAKGGRVVSIPGVAGVGVALVSVNRKLSAITFDAKGKAIQPPNGIAQPAGLDPTVLNWREILE